MSHRVNLESDDSGLDSFLDIITNVIGVLILIGATIALQVMDATVDFGTPILQEPDSDMEALQFHCDNERIVEADYHMGIWEDLILAEVNRKWPEGLSYQQVFELMQDRKFGSPDVASEFVVNNSGYLLKTNVLPGPTRGSLKDLRGRMSDFEKRLESLDPKTTYLYFFVSNSSFEVFQAAREIGREKGFRSGWEPLGDDGTLWTGIHTNGFRGSNMQLND